MKVQPHGAHVSQPRITAALQAALPWLAPVTAALAQLPVVFACWSGERYPGFPTLRSDTLNARKLALDTWLTLAERWQDAEGPGGVAAFLARDLWQVPVDSRALNLLDMALVVWPAQAIAGQRAVLLQSVLLVVLAAVGGQLFARALGAGPAGRAAAGLVAGTSGLTLTTAALGQIPQAITAPALLSLAGLWRISEGRRGGVPLAAVGLALTALLYWQGALVLGLGWLLFALGGLAGRGPRAVARALPAAAAAGAVGALLVAPAAWPVLTAMGSEPLLDTLPYGTPFPTPGTPEWVAWPRAEQTLYDAIALPQLLSPLRGWLVPALALLPAVVLGAWGRWRAAAPWLALLLVALLVVGPYPALTDERSLTNPIYDAAFRWLPTASRMHHPMRWAVPMIAGLAALAAVGMDRIGAARPRLAAGLLAAGALQAAAIGPWPLTTSPWPGGVARALSDCEVIYFPSAFDAQWLDHARAHTSGLAWRPGRPPPTHADLPFALPSGEAAEAVRAEKRDLRRLLSGKLPAALAPGGCVVLDAGVQGVGRQRAGRRLEDAFGPPESVQVAPGLLYPGDDPGALLIFRVPR